MRFGRILLLLVVVIVGGCQMAAREVGLHKGAGVSSEASVEAFGGTGLRDFSPGVGEELWIIGKPAAGTGEAGGVRAGLWQVDGDGQTREAPALLHTEVAARMTGCVACVNVTQRFENTTAGKVDAVYTIPLPEGAGVDDFVLTIGERHIRGIIRERAEAERIFAEARRQGYAASLLMQDRGNGFSQEIANVPAGKVVEVGVRYFHVMGFKDGGFEWRFPVGAICGGGDVGIGVRIDAALGAGEIVSLNHQVLVRGDGAGGTLVRLDARDAEVRKDFVLRWKWKAEAGAEGRPRVFVERDADGKGGTFMLMWVPGEKADVPRRGVEAVFVVDGRMGGEWQGLAKRVVDAWCAKLTWADESETVNFPATSILASEMKALNLPHRAGRTRIMLVLGSGSFGDPVDMVPALGKELECSRVLAVGIGPGANRGSLDTLAMMGHGNAAYFGKGDDVEGVVGDWFEKVMHPLVTDVSLDWGGLKVMDVCPARVPEVVAGRVVVVTGRFVGELRGDLTVTEQVAGKGMRFVIPLKEVVTENAGVAGVWARMRMAEILRGGMVDGGDVGGEMRRVALERNLVSGFTSFLVVDAAGR